MPYSKQDKRPQGAASSWYRDYHTTRLVAPQGAGNAPRRRMRHEEVGVGMGMLRHDGEIEGVVMEDDVVKSRHKSFQAI